MEGFAQRMDTPLNICSIKSSNAVANRENYRLGDNLELLLLSRKSGVKGHDFSIRILEKLHEMGIKAKLTMTGARFGASQNFRTGSKLFGMGKRRAKRRLVRGGADFLISPSDYEGSSMSVIEAIVSGLPAIVSEASRETIGISELVAGIARNHGLRRLLIGTNWKYNQIKEMLRERSSTYSIEKCKVALGEIYESLIV